MAADTLLGIFIILIGGGSCGLFTLPFRYIRGWDWSHYWLVYACYGAMLLPWILVLFTVSDAFQVYQQASTRGELYCVGFGFLWGIGSILFGLGVDMVGNALGFAIILGLTSALGSAIPLVVLHTSEVASKEGICVWVGLLIVFVGLYFLAQSGRMREQDQEILQMETKLLLPFNDAVVATPKKKKTPFTVGLIVCLLSGVFSCMLNLGLTFGDDVTKTAENNGASKLSANNATWALTISSGGIANVAYCAYLVFKERSAHRFCTNGPKATPVRNAALCALAGAMWFGGNVLYGIGSQYIGELGTVLGWPMTLCSMIMTSNIVGILTGEWAGSSTRAKMWGAGGLMLLLVAVIVIAVGSA